MTEKDNKPTEDNIIDIEKTEKIDVTTDDNTQKEDDTTTNTEPEYEVYGKEVRDEAKKTVDGFIGEIFSNLKSRQDEFNKTVKDLKTNKPQFDIFITEEDIIVKVDLPRITKDDIELKISTEAVEIDATFPEDLKEYEIVKVLKQDRCQGQTKTIIPLPEEIAINEVTAKYEDNVLTITLPKIRGRKVDVEIV